jgi:hypothetical protein
VRGSVAERSSIPIWRQNLCWIAIAMMSLIFFGKGIGALDQSVVSPATHRAQAANN